MEIGVTVTVFERYPEEDIRERVSICHRESDQSPPARPS
jgi:hypothetical protein